MRFYEEGVAPRKNAAVMAEAMEAWKEAAGEDAAATADGDAAADEEVKPKAKKSKKKRAEVRARPAVVLGLMG